MMFLFVMLLFMMLLFVVFLFMVFLFVMFLFVVLLVVMFLLFKMESYVLFLVNNQFSGFLNSFLAVFENSFLAVVASITMFFADLFSKRNAILVVLVREALDTFFLALFDERLSAGFLSIRKSLARSDSFSFTSTFS